ncbi:MAG: DUF5056 domain-containing protein [Dysgonamonadaceae bacterium]|jgi:hypothetical protein|nr:DUF5056 domain-containing protein [Dysgonamonadaceae bacterium]
MTDSSSVSAPDVGRWFKAHRQEFADNGFTERLMRQLPPKPSLLPAAAAAIGVAASVVAGFLMLLASLNAGVATDNIRNSLAAAVSFSSWLSAALSDILHAAAVAAATAIASTASLPPLLAGAIVTSLMGILALSLAAFGENNEAAW